jgi:hypothetical protein
VDRNLVMGVLEAVAAVHPRWKDTDGVWKAYEAWAARNKRELPGSLGNVRVLYHQLQDLYVFAIESCPKVPEERIMAACGAALGENLLRERLSDLVAQTLSEKAKVAPALESLFLLFMHQYGPYVFQGTAVRKGEALQLSIQYARPD